MLGFKLNYVSNSVSHNQGYHLSLQWPWGQNWKFLMAKKQFARERVLIVVYETKILLSYL